jgi:tetratricopeptide (TPR) repeat protein
MQPRACAVLTIALLSFAASAFAHEDERPGSAAGERLGEVSFPIACSEAAQREFNRGVAILHSFYYPDAVKSFTRVSELDPGCSIAHWGVAMSLWYPLWYAPSSETLQQGRAALAQATQHAIKDRRERDYIEAIGAFYRDFETLDHKTRALAYEKAMEQVYQRYPDDDEAAAFYALALQATADPNDKSYAKQRKSGAILEPLYAKRPNHPGVAHYLIHAYDYPELAPRALDAARHYGEIAPAMPHALHMPSHTFIALGLWEDSIQSNLAANAAAKNLGWVQEELHTMDYLVYAYLQSGQGRAAADVKNRIEAIAIREKHTLGMDYAVAAAPARYVIEQRRWVDAAALRPPESTFPATIAITHYVRALGAARSGALVEAQKDVDKLGQIRDVLSKAKQDYWAKQVEIQRQTAAAWLVWAKGEGTEAVNLMRAAADLEDSSYKNPVMPAYILPARELLGDMLLELQQPAQALVEYEASLRAVPNRFNGLYGAARAAQNAHDQQKAKHYYSELLRICSKGDGDRPELQRAQLYLASL